MGSDCISSSSLLIFLLSNCFVFSSIRSVTDIMNDHGLEQLVHFPTRGKNTLDLILTSLPVQF